MWSHTRICLFGAIKLNYNANPPFIFKNHQHMTKNLTWKVFVYRKCLTMRLPINKISHRDGTTLRVIDYSAKSFKVTQGHSKWQCWVGRKSLLVFHCTMSVSRTVSEIFNVKEWRDLKIVGMGRSRSLKMAPDDRSYTTFYWSAIVSIALSCTIFELFGVE